MSPRKNDHDPAAYTTQAYLLAVCVACLSTALLSLGAYIWLGGPSVEDPTLVLAAIALCLGEVAAVTGLLLGDSETNSPGKPAPDSHTTGTPHGRQWREGSRGQEDDVVAHCSREARHGSRFLRRTP